MKPMKASEFLRRFNELVAVHGGDLDDIDVVLEYHGPSGFYEPACLELQYCIPMKTHRSFSHFSEDMIAGDPPSRAVNVIKVY